MEGLLTEDFLRSVPAEYRNSEDLKLALLQYYNETGNSSAGMDNDDILGYPLHYRISAILCHSLILILGVTGNIMLIYVARKSPTLQTPTYCYLVSLAYADLLVTLTAVPEAILYHVYGSWLMGPVGCAFFIYLNFVSINAGSLSILAFTLERFIAICYPLPARKLCTIQRTTKLIKGTWIFTLLYCSPWLGLTAVRDDLFHTDREQCTLRLSREAYIAVFGTDLLLFYVIPLVVAVIVYTRIGRVLYRRQTSMRGGVVSSDSLRTGDSVERDLFRLEQAPSPDSRRQLLHTARYRVRVVRMLIVVVTLFAVSWLPYRGLLVYNTFVEEPWLDFGYLFFAKSLIYLNSAVNPFVYNVMSRRFRVAVRKSLCSDPACTVSSSMSLPFRPAPRLIPLSELSIF